jgi:hypothetical protein
MTDASVSRSLAEADVSSSFASGIAACKAEHPWRRRGQAVVGECAGMSRETASSRLSELAPITQPVKRQKQALGEFVQR